jgi:hypothetical protein
MSNTANTLKNAPGVVAKLAAAMFADKVQLCKTIDKEDASAFEGMNGYNSGDTIYISKPARFVVGSTADITSTIQDIKEEKVALSLDIRGVVAVKMTSLELATEMNLKSWAKRVLEPQISAMAQYVEKTVAEKCSDATFNAVGTPGSSVYNTELVLKAGQKIDENACPDFANRFILLNPAANTSAVDARKGLFQSSEEISKQYKEGAMGMADGFTFLRNNLLPIHTNGNDVVFEVRTTVVTEGQATLVVEALTTTTGTVKKGTVFTIAGVNAVHPVTKDDLGYLQQFVATADKTADGSGYATLTISPALYTSASGGLQTVTAFPQDGAAITPVGAASTGYKQSLAYHKSAFRMVSVPLVLPEGADMAAQETVDGFTIRVIRDYDVITDVMIMRIDFLGGVAAVRPEWAVRIYN